MKKKKVYKFILNTHQIVLEYILSLKEKVFIFFRKYFYLKLISITLVFAVLVSQVIPSYADVVRFYPTACLGGWKNSEKAEGQRDIEGSGTFSEDNSAVLENAIATLYCGGFKGEIPKDTTPKKIIVAFSGGTNSDNSSQNVLPQSSGDEESSSQSENNVIESAESDISEEVLGGEEVIIDPLEEPVPNTDETLDSNSQPEPPPESSSEPEEAPTETPSEPSAPSSWFASFAHAETIENSVQDENSKTGDSLEVKYTVDGNEWNLLGTVSRENLNDAKFEIPTSAFDAWADLSKFQISVESLPSLDNEPTVYIDALWLEVEYEEVETLSKFEISLLPRVEVGEEEIFSEAPGDFRSNENPEFEINVFDENSETILPQASTTETIIEPPEENATSTEDLSEEPLSFLKGFFDLFKVGKAIAEEVIQKKVLKAEIFSPDGSLYEEKPIIQNDGEKIKITIPQISKSFRPGQYTMRVEVLSGDKVLVSSVSFGWGVLAVNTDKSSYLPGQEVYLQLGALTSEGHTMCDASLSLEIIRPDNSVEIFTTSSGEIIHSEVCAKNNFTYIPDYFAYFIPQSIGEYVLKLKNNDNGYTVSDSFIVESRPFVVERVSATRINPFISEYRMDLRIVSLGGFKGEVSEMLPSGFSISSTTPNANFSSGADSSEIVWNVDIPAGGSIDLSYVYQAPLISPELFTLGPMIFKSAGQIVYVEERSWQLASDAACNATASGNWSDGSKFSGCSGVGGVPDSTDDVTINSGVVMTVDSNSSVNTITVAANAAAGGNAIIINSAINLSVTGAVTMVSPTASSSAIYVGAGNLSAASIAIPGSATASRFSTVSVSTGTVTTTGNITFSGTAAQARFISTGASVTTVGGNFSSGGTLTTSGTGTIIFNGGVAQTIGAYTTYNNIQITGNSTVVNSAGTTTIGGTLTIDSGASLAWANHTLTVTGATSISGTLTHTGSTTSRTFVGLITVNNGGTWTDSTTGTASFVVRNGITNNGTFSPSTRNHTFNTNNGQQINSVTSLSFGTLTVTGVTLTSNVSLTVSTALSGTGSLTMANNTTLTLGGTSGITTLVVDGTGVVTDYSSASAQTIKSTTYTTLKINNTNSTGASLTTGGATVTTLTIGDTASTARFQDAGFTLSLSGSSVLNLTQGTYDLGSASVGTTFPSFGTINISSGTTIEYGAAVSQTIESSLAYQNLLVTGGVTRATNGNLSIAGSLTVSGASSIFDADNYVHTITGNIVVGTNASLLVDSSTIELQGSTSGAGTLNGGTGLVKLTGGGTQTLGVTTQSFYNLTLEKTSGTSATQTVGTTINNALTITSGTYVIGGTAHTNNGTTSVTDTLSITSSTGTKAFGNITINNGGLMSFSAASAITANGNLQVDGTGTISGTTGLWTFQKSGGGGTISGSASLITVAGATFTTAYTTSIPLTITGTLTVTTVTLTNNSTLTVTTALSGTGGVTQGTDSTLNIGGTSAITSLDASTNVNTVNYTGGTQTAKAVTYHHLGLSGSGTKTLTSITTVNGNMSTAGTCAATTAANFAIAGTLTVGGTSTFTVGGFDFTVTGTTTISGGILAHSSNTGTKLHVGRVTLDSGSWTNAGSESFNFRGGITVNGGTFTGGSGIYEFDTNDQTIEGSQSLSFSDMEITGVTVTNNNTGGLNTTAVLSGTGTLVQGVNAVLGIVGTDGTSFDLATLVATANGNVVNYNRTGAGQAIRSQTYQILKINNNDATNGARLNGDVTVNKIVIGDITSSSVFHDDGHTITLSGTSELDIVSGTFRIGSTTVGSTFPNFDSVTLASGTTVQYYASVAQTVKGRSYQNLTISNASTKTLDGNMSVAGTLTVGGSSLAVILDLSSYTHLVSGNLSVVTAATLTASSSTLEVQGDMSGAGTFSGGTSTLKLTGSGTRTSSITNQTTYYDVIVEKDPGSSFGTNTNNMIITHNLSVNSGTFNMSGITTFRVDGTTTIDSDAAVTFSSTATTKTFVGAVTINGSWTNSVNHPIVFRGGLTVGSGGTFTSGTGTHTFNTNPQSIGDGAAFSITNVTVTGVTLTNNNTAGFTAATTLAGTGGITQGTNAILNIGGTSAITTVDLDASGNTVNYSGSAQTVKAVDYHNLDLSGSGVKTFAAGTDYIYGNLTTSGTILATTSDYTLISGNLSVGSGTRFAFGTDSGGNNTFSVGGTTDVSGTLSKVSGSGSRYFTGRVTINSGGSYDMGSGGDIHFRGGITFNGDVFSTPGGNSYIFETNNQSIEGSQPFSIYNVTVTGVTLTNNNTAGFTAATTLAGTGGLTQGTNAILTIGGTSAITTVDFDASGNTVEYNSTTAGQTVKSTTYHNLTIDKTGQTGTLAGATVVNGNLSIDAGTLDTSSGNGYALSVKGNWINNGTFTPRTGTVTFNGTGNQTINDSNTWYGLAITGTIARTVSFESAATQTISANGSLTLSGALNNLLTLSPLTPSTDWLLRVSNTGVTQNISYVSPSYSDAGTLGVDAQIDASDGTNDDGGNNTNWNFSGALSFSISDNAVGFGTVSPVSARFATADASGSGSAVSAHDLSATGPTGGYTITVQGDSPECGAYSIAPIGGTNTGSNPGTEQFGIRLSASGGSGEVSSPYAAAGYAYGADNSTPSQIANASGQDSGTTYSVYYLSNISSQTEACDYSSTLNYIMTPNF